MAKRDQRRALSEAERDAYVTVQRGHDRASIVKEAIRWGCFGWLGWLAYRCVPYLAGRATNVGVGVVADILGSDEVVRVLLGSVTAVLLFLWRREKTLNKELIQHHGEMRRVSEEAVDPDRTSSGLLQTGENKPDDPL